MINAKFWLIFTICVIQLSASCAQTKKFNVKDYGAVGDGKNDDYDAFQKTFSDAVKYPESEITIPYGIYKVSKTLDLFFYKNSISIKGGSNRSGKKPQIICEKPANILNVRGYFSNPSEGQITISNLGLKGSNEPYHEKHELINRSGWYCGLLVTDKKSVKLSDIVVEDIYGQGIHVSTTSREKIEDGARIARVEITNCYIINVWGSDPKSDSYGDGIYVAHAASGSISGNTISNDVLKTKQLGRGGIVLEYQVEGFLVSKNRVEGGYDRPMHIEDTYGGHDINDNYLAGSDLGLVIAENVGGKFAKMLVRNNYITNKGFSKGLIKSYNSEFFGDRALLFVTSPRKNNSGIIVFTGNTFNLNSEFPYESDRIVNLFSEDVEMDNNTFEVSNSKKSYSILNRSGKNLKNSLIKGNINTVK